MRRAVSLEDVIFFHLGSVEAGAAFFAERAPGARLVSDPKAVLYDAMGLHRGSVMQLAGPKVWWQGLKATLQGFLPGVPGRDVQRMPGVFQVEGRQVVWAYRSRTAGDVPMLRMVGFGSAD